jgi:histidine ammonia-lyase
MLKNSLLSSVVGVYLLLTGTAMADVPLSGQGATPEMIVRVANGEAVTVAPESLEKVARAYEILLQGAKEGQEIYGLTVGVGWNKDRKMVDAAGELTPELMEASREFNEGLLRAHSVGVGRTPRSRSFAPPWRYASTTF